MTARGSHTNTGIAQQKRPANRPAFCFNFIARKIRA